MLNILPLLLIIFPVLSQLILGSYSIYKSSSLKFSPVSWINFLLQIIFSFAAFNIADYNLTKQYEPNPVRCGMPLVGMAVACFFFIFILIIIIVIQFLIKRWRVKRNTV
ncbi:hypothetical protein [Flavobacterium johnsoniae]|uniref:Uncharacterized protein n=1 Tax=Flavobacterium johnsoniae (strain ATCC 17061 / DSM 2064 / JCM 8514 / BCRC 14874 / CCUG 350202 / NBRC 14942 / NCIMB 11054 / UW101) TaxID=376686 RepID=A5FE52_FLAJ1|nr:hypothetical protein [Flavobacterium johnsoniae]ABQ06526.1 hypothetical protein Fjoh_3512 [Flavobacterium johnsoniae UW101]OXE99765.1 hypothetical protein B0A63_10695 [Flavobacterium johnsoniae UW101]WQG82278.1 hypothetical protein SR927_03995 [Flavobacterium johnsoniae UW101]SHK78388.1 hypothetical protein SAMN05444146_2262 [Flavobacterium johnsoniae]